MQQKQKCLAERQGFEPWVGLHPQRFSRPPRSTAPAPLREAGRAGYLRSLSGARHFGTAVVLEEPCVESSETRGARTESWRKKTRYAGLPDTFRRQVRTSFGHVLLTREAKAWSPRPGSSISGIVRGSRMGREAASSAGRRVHGPIVSHEAHRGRCAASVACRAVVLPARSTSAPDMAIGGRKLFRQRLHWESEI